MTSWISELHTSQTCVSHLSHLPHPLRHTSLVRRCTWSSQYYSCRILLLSRHCLDLWSPRTKLTIAVPWTDTSLYSTCTNSVSITNSLGISLSNSLGSWKFTYIGLQHCSHPLPVRCSSIPRVASYLPPSTHSLYSDFIYPCHQSSWQSITRHTSAVCTHLVHPRSPVGAVTNTLKRKVLEDLRRLSCEPRSPSLRCVSIQKPAS